MATGITTYGERNAQAPGELDLFAFLVGKWNGVGSTRIEDGSRVEFGLTWIGRYILNGMAIADEIHALGPDGKPHLGISLRQFDPQHGAWVVEFLNVTGSFLRSQVNPGFGSVRLEGNTIVIESGDIREDYGVVDQDHFTYRMGQVEMSMTRVA